MAGDESLLTSEDGYGYHLYTYIPQFLNLCQYAKEIQKKSFKVSESFSLGITMTKTFWLKFRGNDTLISLIFKP